MNKVLKIILAALGSLHAVYYIISPIILYLLFMVVASWVGEVTEFGITFWAIICFGAVFFRALKVGGWINKNE